jgi:hypothetical protein
MDLTYEYLSLRWDCVKADIEDWLEQRDALTGRPNVADLQRSIINKKQQIKKYHAQLFATKGTGLVVSGGFVSLFVLLSVILFPVRHFCCLCYCEDFTNNRS